MVPSLAVRFILRPDDVIVGGATGSLWAELLSISIGSSSESLASRTYIYESDRFHILISDHNISYVYVHMYTILVKYM